MKNIKTKLVKETEFKFENKVNQAIEELNAQGLEIVDIKYTIGLIGMQYALIIYSLGGQNNE